MVRMLIACHNIICHINHGALGLRSHARSVKLPGVASVDLEELKGFGKPLSSLSNGLDGQVVLLQASPQTKRLIPDMATWTQCFAVYIAVLLTRYLSRVQSLLMYMAQTQQLTLLGGL